MLTIDEARRRVAKGAAHLDQVRPGWEHRINIAAFDVGSCVGCALAQSFGVEYAEACALAHLEHRSVHGAAPHPDVYSRGFFGVNPQEKEALNEAWVELIGNRLYPDIQIATQPTETPERVAP